MAKDFQFLCTTRVDVSEFSLKKLIEEIGYNPAYMRELGEILAEAEKDKTIPNLAQLIGFVLNNNIGFYNSTTMELRNNAEYDQIDRRFCNLHFVNYMEVSPNEAYSQISDSINDFDTTDLFVDFIPACNRDFVIADMGDYLNKIYELIISEEEPSFEPVELEAQYNKRFQEAEYDAPGM